MESERRRHLLEEPERMVARHRNPYFALHGLELPADARRHGLHLGHVVLVLGVRQREELRRMRQQGAAEDAGHLRISRKRRSGWIGVELSSMPKSERASHT